MGTTQDERRAIMEQAQLLLDELREMRARVNELTARLVEAGDSIIMEAMDEKQGERTTTKRKITYGPAAPEPKEHEDEAPKKRKCSICRQPGHRATTCTNGRNK